MTAPQTPTPFSPYSADWLQAQVYPDTRWVVEKVLPEGLCVFVAKSKVGKTWLALGAAIAIALGGRFLGAYPSSAGQVLYLDLDQRHPRRTRRRMDMMMREPGRWPGNLHFENQIPRIGEEGKGSKNLFLDALYAWCSGRIEGLPVAQPRLVVVDTAGCVWPRRLGTGGGNAYYAEYALLDSIRKLAAEFPGLSVMMVHHESKSLQVDVLDKISGTAAWAAAADSIWVLTRNREKRESELYITGKEVQEQRLTLRFDWHIGSFAQVDAAAEEDAWWQR